MVEYTLGRVASNKTQHCFKDNITLVCEEFNMSEQGKRFGQVREELESAIKRTNSNIASLQFQTAEEQIQDVNDLFDNLTKLANSESAVQQRALQRIATDIQNAEVDIQNGLARREAGKREAGNVAFKYNWNDAGYKGICSDDVYEINRKSVRTECARSNCRDFVGKPPPIDECCYECQALRVFKFGAGWDHDENNIAVRPRHIKDVRKGRIAILTSIPHWAKERLVIGAFQISLVKEDSKSETYLYGDETTAIDDMLSYQIEFWRHHKNPYKPESQAWGQGLFRYISNVAILGILEEYRQKRMEHGLNTNNVDVLIAALPER